VVVGLSIDSHWRSLAIVSMDTIVSAKVLAAAGDPDADRELERALGWFAHVERLCSRFNPESEVFRLVSQPGQPVRVSPVVFEAIHFALEIARLSDGAFDPTIGVQQARRGFDRDYVTGRHVGGDLPGGSDVSFRDVTIDTDSRTVTLRQPLLIDLGAVAKGMAIDLAARQLDRFEAFSIDAGGDIFVKGHNEQGEAWTVGVEHPRQEGLIATLRLPGGAICTSGDYVRTVGPEGQHHLLDPRTGSAAMGAISCTVLAPDAMLADALSTAAFVAGPVAGMRIIADQAVEGMIVAADLTTAMTPGFERLLV